MPAFRMPNTVAVFLQTSVPSGLGLSAGSGLLIGLSQSLPWLGFAALAPLFVAVYRSRPAQASLYGAVAGAIGSWLVIGGLITFPGGRLFEGLAVLGFGLVLAGGMALASWLWRPRLPAFGLLLLPAVIVAIQPILELPLGRTANIAIGALPLLPTLHVSHLGGHLLADGLLALTGATLAVVWLGRSTLRQVVLPLAAVLFWSWPG